MPSCFTLVVANTAGSEERFKKSCITQCEQISLGLEHHTVTHVVNHTLVELLRDENGSISFDQKYLTSIPSAPSLVKNRI